jgi:tetratricopeptide (TPR) repeat protein
MATKAKSQSAPKSDPLPQQIQPSPLAATFSKALKLVEGGKHAEAAKALEALIKEAQDAGEWGLKRRAQVYLALAEAKQHPAKIEATDAVSEIQSCLNHRDSEGAIKLVEKAIKSHPTHGILYYLKAVAHAQSDQVEASADSLKKAMELDHDLVFQWHMEPDFNAIRKSALFGFTEGR